VEKDITNLLDAENAQIRRLQEIVRQTIEDEKLIVQNLLNPPKEILKRGQNDYLINLKAELEIRALHQKLDLLLQEQIKVLFESQAKQIELLKKIESKL